MKIEQCLYGYQNGHQLLASSIDLTSEEKRLLLFQTDLSGAMTDSGFDEYLTGFPIPQNNTYAFCKTWYAQEMKRPGCVWTHVLLIPFSDLGKIPELEFLTKFFKRPQVNDYANYVLPLTIDEIELQSGLDIAYSPRTREIMHFTQFALYSQPEATILVPAFRSEEFEIVAARIWSNQWPRLRRNFTFCTGALSLKTIDGREFDLQVVPAKNLSSIQRQTTNGLIAETIYPDSVNWLSLLDHENKQAVRKFLWIFGSDVEGVRKNFTPLVTLYESLSSDNYSLDSVAQLLTSNFQSSEEAKSLKTKTFGQDSLLKRYSDEAILKFLLAADDNIVASLGILDVEERIKNFAPQEQLSVILGAKPERLTPTLLKSIMVSKGDLVKIIERDETLIDSYISQFPEIALEPEIWKTSTRFQKKVLKCLHDSRKIENWTPYFNTIFEMESAVISDLSKLFGNNVGLAALDWLNQKDFSLTYIRQIQDIVNPNIIFAWLHNKQNKPQVNTLHCLFLSASKVDFQKAKIAPDTLFAILKSVKDAQDFPLKIRAYCILLSLGLDNIFTDSDLIVSESFHEVYEFSKKRRIEPSLWEQIPQEVALNSTKQNDNFDIPFWTYPWANLQRSSPKNQSEILLRTLINKFIRNSWPKKSFITAIKEPSQVQAVYQYCLSFREGKRFLREVEDVARGYHNSSKS